MNNFNLSGGVLLVTVLLYIAIACQEPAQSEGTMATTSRDTEGSDYFCEMHNGCFDHAFGLEITGPNVFRKSNSRAYVFSVVSCEPLEVKDLIPFAIVVECGDSLLVLTDLDIQLGRTGFEIGGRIRFPEGEQLWVTYELDYEREDGDLEETIRLEIEGERKQILETGLLAENGRVFVIGPKDQPGITQVDVELINDRVLKLIRSIEPSEAVKYGLLEESYAKLVLDNE